MRRLGNLMLWRREDRDAIGVGRRASLLKISRIQPVTNHSLCTPMGVKWLILKEDSTLIK